MATRQLKFKALIEYKDKKPEWVTYSIGDKPDFHYMYYNGLIKEPLVEDLQFTGLLDKEGVEIYEGDCVKYDNGDTGKVVFRFGQFYAYNGYARDSVEAEMKLYDDSAPFDDGFEIEIIGNIHDNPELL